MSAHWGWIGSQSQAGTRDRTANIPNMVGCYGRPEREGRNNGTTLSCTTTPTSSACTQKRYNYQLVGCSNPAPLYFAGGALFARASFLSFLLSFTSRTNINTPPRPEGHHCCYGHW
jgi:hypothetical protein